MSPRAPEPAAFEEMRDVLRNLFTIEVSTILKRGMSAEKMPPAPIALLDIAGDYFSFLNLAEARWQTLAGFLAAPGQRGADIAVLQDTVAAKEAADPDHRAQICRWQWLWHTQLGSADTRRNSAATFEALAGLARLMRNTLAARIAAAADSRLAHDCEQDVVIIQRIHQNASVLASLIAELGAEQRAQAGRGKPSRAAPATASAAVADRLDPSRPCPPDGAGDGAESLWNASRAWFHPLANYREATRVPLTPDEITLIRKVWETGTEIVVMQSVIQLDGDVITRIHPDYANEQAALLQGLHNSATRTAIETWFDIARLVREMASGVLTALTGLLHRGG